MELRNSTSQLAGMELPGTLLFDYPSVAALAGYLSQQMADAGDVLSDEASTMESASSYGEEACGSDDADAPCPVPWR